MEVKNNMKGRVKCLIDNCTQTVDWKNYSTHVKRAHEDRKMKRDEGQCYEIDKDYKVIDKEEQLLNRKNNRGLDDIREEEEDSSSLRVATESNTLLKQIEVRQ